jgi:hypothetical protein
MAKMTLSWLIAPLVLRPQLIFAYGRPSTNVNYRVNTYSNEPCLGQMVKRRPLKD